MREIDESYLARKIRDICSESKSNLDIFTSLVSDKGEKEYNRIDYEAFFTHFIGMIETMTLIKLYQSNFNREKFGDMKFHLEDYIAKTKKNLVESLLKREYD